MNNHCFERAKGWGHIIKKCYQSLGVDISITGVQIISGLLRYIFTLELLPGTRVQTIFTHAKDVQAALGLYLFYPFREGISLRIAVSEFDIKENRLLNILRSPMFFESKMEIPLALGYDLMGSMYLADLTKLLHLLVVGPSGTGKSVALQCIVLSIIVRCPANSVRLLLFDIGANSLSVFDDIVHLCHPIVKDTTTGIVALESLVAEIDRRSALDVKECQNLPYIVCIIDEFDDTIASIQDKEKARRFTVAINSLIRRGRKAKVILILASHDPTLKNTKVNINGIIPRIVFQCAKHQNSSTALGVTGAENLPGGGAMLFKSQNGTPIPLQGSFITPAEIERILDTAPTGCDDCYMLEIWEPETEIDGVVLSNNATDKNSKNREVVDITLWALRQDAISVRRIQQTFKIGNRAAEIMDALYHMGIVEDKFSNQPRKVLSQTIEDIPTETVEFLAKNGVSTDEIVAALEQKSAT